MKKLLLVVIVVVLMLGVAGCWDEPSEPEAPGEPVGAWKDNLEPGLATEIENAFAEIDENEVWDYTLKSVALERVNETPICIFRYYKVIAHIDTSLIEKDMSFVIRTREWKEGEPEKAEYPKEYLECVNDEPGGLVIWTRADGYIE